MASIRAKHASRYYCKLQEYVNPAGSLISWRLGLRYTEIFCRTYLVGFHTLGSLLLLLFADDDEGAAVFVECETHILLFKRFKL